MEANRLALHEKLCTLLGSRNVYFQPPESIIMRYPAIRYTRGVRKKYANDGSYLYLREYEVILIDEDPDSQFLDALLELPYCTLNRTYVADNLNHFVFTLYF